MKGTLVFTTDGITILVDGNGKQIGVERWVQIYLDHLEKIGIHPDDFVLKEIVNGVVIEHEIYKDEDCQWQFK